MEDGAQFWYVIMHTSPATIAATCMEVYILEGNLSRDFLYQMSNIEYPYVNND